MGRLAFAIIFFTLGVSLRFGIIHGDIQIDVKPEKLVSVLEDEAQITCFMDGNDDDGKEISAIQLYKNTATPIVLLRDCTNISYEAGASSNVKAQGYIGKNSAKSYLNLTISYPESKDTGIYTCVVYYFDKGGVLKEDRINRTLTVANPSVSDLGSAIGRMRTEMKTIKEEYRQALKEESNKSSNLLISLRDKANYHSSFIVTADDSFYLSSTNNLILPDVISRFGDDYDEDTGVFSPKKPGIYAFSLQLRTQNTVYLEFRVNEDTIGKLTCSYNDNWETASLSVVHELWPSDEMKIVMTSGSSKFHSGRQVLYSGYLVKLL